MFSCELLKPGDGLPLSLISFASVCLGFSQDLQACHGYYEIKGCSSPKKIQ